MKNHRVLYQDWDLIEYGKAFAMQEELFQSSVQLKGQTIEKEIPNFLIFCEHPDVYTLGKSGSEKNLLLNHIQLKAQNVTFFNTNRGGDITYHGPGQIVGYPIIDLENFDISLKKYIHLLEESIIEVLQLWNISSARLSGATGVWIDVDKPKLARKICAIGVKSSRYVTMHGFAFNVNTDLQYFQNINPCGFIDKGVTSMEHELGKHIDIKKVKEQVKEQLAEQFNFEYL